MQNAKYRQCWVWRPKADEWVSHPPWKALAFLHLRRWRPAFLRPKGEIHICHRADEQNALKIDCSLPPIKVLTKPVHLRKPSNPQPMRKTHLTQSWDVHKSPSLHLSSELRASGLHCTSLAVAFPFSNKSHFIYRLWLIIQLPREPVPCLHRPGPSMPACSTSTPARNSRVRRSSEEVQKALVPLLGLWWMLSIWEPVTNSALSSRNPVPGGW
jgi:hypothetical protein